MTVAMTNQLSFRLDHWTIVLTVTQLAVTIPTIITTKTRPGPANAQEKTTTIAFSSSLVHVVPTHGQVQVTIKQLRPSSVKWYTSLLLLLLLQLWHYHKAQT